MSKVQTLTRTSAVERLEVGTHLAEDSVYHMAVVAHALKSVAKCERNELLMTESALNKIGLVYELAKDVSDQISAASK